MDKLETEEYKRTCRDINMEMKEQTGIKLIDKVIKDASLWGAYKKVKANEGHQRK